MLLAAAFLFAHAALPATAASTYVNPRLPTEQDVAEARDALKALLPNDHEAYELADTGLLQPRNTKWVAFHSPLPETVSAVSRAKRVSCAYLGDRWICRGPSIQIFTRGHTFPEPQDIDDKTIVEIAEFFRSRCFDDQLQALGKEGKLKSPRPAPGRVQISEMETGRVEGAYSITGRGSGRGSTYFIARDNDPGSTCGFRLLGVGSWVAMVPEDRRQTEAPRAAWRLGDSICSRSTAPISLPPFPTPNLLPQSVEHVYIDFAHGRSAVDSACSLEPISK